MHHLRAVLLASGLLALSVFTCGASPISDLLSRVEVLEAGFDALVARVEAVEQALLPPTEQVLLDDDFEDGIDPAWTLGRGTWQPLESTGDCNTIHWSRYANCGSLALTFEGLADYVFELPSPAKGILTLYFHDDATDTEAAAFVGLTPNQERLGVNTEVCPNHYFISLRAGANWCTPIPRGTGWHRVDLMRTGEITRGFIDHTLAYETRHPERMAIERVILIQEVPWLLLNGFAIDDLRVVSIE